MAQVTGIGGIFFKADDPEKMYEWYEKHLGIKREHGFVSFHWREDHNPDEKGTTAWAIFDWKSNYFDPSRTGFMVNYRVQDLDAVIEALRAGGVEIHKREDCDYGRFAWITDPEGNKIELWQPR